MGSFSRLGMLAPPLACCAVGLYTRVTVPGACRPTPPPAPPFRSSESPIMFDGITFTVPFDNAVVELAGLFSVHEISTPTDRTVSSIDDSKTDDLRRMVCGSRGENRKAVYQPVGTMSPKFGVGMISDLHGFPSPYTPVSELKAKIPGSHGHYGTRISPPTESGSLLNAQTPA